MLTNAAYLAINWQRKKAGGPQRMLGASSYSSGGCVCILRLSSPLNPPASAGDRSRARWFCVFPSSPIGERASSLALGLDIVRRRSGAVAEWPKAEHLYSRLTH